MSVQRYTELGKRIRQARHRKGWSKAKLAELLGCERQRIILWEKGANRPNPNYRGSLEDFLGPIDWSPDSAGPMSPEESGADMRVEQRYTGRAA